MIKLFFKKVVFWLLFQPTPQPQPQPQPAPQPQPVGILWASGVTYTVNSIVSYQGDTYKCLTPHTSIVTWAPGPFTGALWQLIA